MRGPKVVLIGAGSAFFGRQTIWSMVTVSIPDARNCLDEMLSSERKYLPAKWFK